MCISEAIDAKAQHVVCFQGFAKQVAITTTILQDKDTQRFEQQLQAPNMVRS